MAKLLLFAHFKEALQLDEIVIPESILTIAQLRDWLSDEYPVIAEPLLSVIWARNEEYADLNEEIEADDVIAIIPPVSGG